MAAPTPATANSLCLDALKRINKLYLFADAKNNWLEEIKCDIWNKSNGGVLKSLHSEQIDITTIGLAKYSMPTDFSARLSITLLNGEHTDTAQAGQNTSITLASDEDIAQDDIIGKEILITSGIGAGDLPVQCTGYNTTTKVATTTSFPTIPDNTSVYLIVDKYYEIEKKSIRNINDYNQLTKKSRPLESFFFSNADEGYYWLYPVPDAVYGIKQRYYANLLELDLSSTLIGNLYNRWRNVFIQGIIARAVESRDNYNLYYEKLNDLLKREIVDEGIDTVQFYPSL